MPLTPRINDPNRRKELTRRRIDPHSFGTDGAGSLPTGWNPGNLKKNTAEKKDKNIPSVPKT